MLQAAVPQAVTGNPEVKMFWSPNSASPAELKSGGCYQTSGAVDIIGIKYTPHRTKVFSLGVPRPLQQLGCTLLNRGDGHWLEL